MFKVPIKTSINKVHDPFTSNKTISFAPELIKFILNRKKYLTYRYADEKYLAFKAGDVVNIKEYGRQEIIGQAKIKSIKLTIFKEIPLKVEGHETPKNKEHQREIFNGYYAFLGRPIEDADKFLIIEFKLLNSSH